MTRTFQDSLDADLTDTFFSTNEFAQQVTINRGVRSTSGVAAISTRRAYDALDADTGMPTAVVSTDFLIVATAYAFDGVQVEPQSADRLTTSGGEIFEALPVSGKQSFEAMSDGKILRVHTKQVA